MSLSVEWDPQKASAIERKHGVSFDKAAKAFGDPLSVTIPDPDDSEDEDCFMLLVSTHRGRILVVVHTDRCDTIRIISARRGTRTESWQYEC